MLNAERGKVKVGDRNTCDPGWLDTSPAWQAGRAHALFGGYKARVSDNPHPRDTDDHNDWHFGFYNAAPLLRLRT